MATNALMKNEEENETNLLLEGTKMVDAVDWKTLKTQKNSNSAFFSVILGQSGAGKSTLIGTLRKPTLFLYTKTEEHAPEAAAAMNPDIYPVRIDELNGEELSPDQTYARLLSILNDPNMPKKFEAVAIDSATELDVIIRQTRTFVQQCKTDKGTHNQWKEGEAVLNHFKEIISALRRVHDRGVHCFLTCAAMVKSLDEAGGVAECTPKLRGFDVAHDLIRNFNDVLLVSRYNETDLENNTIKTLHTLMFKANMTKTSKDMRGNVTKFANFTPRVTGLLAQELPDILVADLQEVLKIKEKKYGKA